LEEITPAAPPVSEPPLPTPSLPFRRPADYYSAPAGERKALFPRWVPYGCGSAAIVALLVVFGVGYAVSRGGMGELLELMFASMQGEIDKMFTRDVKPSEKAGFDAEMKTMRDSVRQNRLPLDRLQPLLRSLREVTMDEHVTPAEAERLTNEIRAINRAPTKKGS
jgi:hypothetical protein